MAVTDRSLTKISANISSNLACAVACGYQTGFSTVIEKMQSLLPRSFEELEKFGAPKMDRALTSPAFRKAQTLSIFGVGAVGLGAIMAGQMVGFGSIIACDISDERLSLARDAGATKVINVKGMEKEDVIARVQEASVDGEGVTLSIEASGAPQAMYNAVMSLAVSGKAIIVGSPPNDAILQIPYGMLLVSPRLYIVSMADKDL